MTTTTYDDQFSAEPEPVHQPYDVAAILRKNVSDLERELLRQRERADKAESAIASAREDLQSFIDSRDAWMARAEKAEAELKAAREQKPVGYVFPDWRGATTVSATRDDHFSVPLYASPIPAPAVPAPEIPDGDAFNGTTLHLIQCIESLVRMNDCGVLVPHGIGGHARTLLLASANRLRQQPAPDEWRKVMAKLVGVVEASTGIHGCNDLTKQARALLQSAEVTK